MWPAARDTLWEFSSIQHLSYLVWSLVFQSGWPANEQVPFKRGVAKVFDPRAEFATAWPLERRMQDNLRNLC